jgi:hypothetical protein
MPCLYCPNGSKQRRINKLPKINILIGCCLKRNSLFLCMPSNGRHCVFPIPFFISLFSTVMGKIGYKKSSLIYIYIYDIMRLVRELRPPELKIYCDSFSFWQEHNLHVLLKQPYATDHPYGI